MPRFWLIVPLIPLLPLVLWMLIKRKGVPIGSLGLRGRMRPVRSRHADRLAFRGPVCHPLAGLAVLGLAAGLLVWGSPAWNRGAAVALSVVGGVLLGLRAGMVLDRGRATVTRWWGLGVPLVAHATRRVAFEGAMITREHRAFTWYFWDVFEASVTIVGEPSQVIDTAGEYARARDLAEAAARFLDIPLMDYAATPEVVRMPAELNAPLRRRVARGHVVLALPEEPRRRRARQIIEEEWLRFDIPPVGLALGWLVVACIAVGLPTAALAATGVLARLAHGGASAGGVAALYAVCAVIALGTRPRVPARGWQVSASPAELRLEARGLLRRRSWTVPVDEVRTLEVVPARAVRPRWIVSRLTPGKRTLLVHTRGETLCAGTGLGQEELDWIRASLEVALNA